MHRSFFKRSCPIPPRSVSTMASEPKTGALLAALAASKPGGRLLELGTGTGIGTAWLLSGMDGDARLDTVDIDEQVTAIARRHLSSDPRLAFHLADGAAFLSRSPKSHYDLIYADAWPGKFSHLDDALSLLTVGGIYFIDDLLPATELAGRTCAKGDSAHRDARAESRFRDGKACVGLRPDDGRADASRIFAPGA